jgi:polyferredoxin
MRFQHLVQAACLILFLLLAWPVVSPLSGLLPEDFFLRLDPIVLLGTGLTGNWPARLWPAALFLLLTPVMGRFFCGHICPMGTTIDLGDAAFSRLRKKHSHHAHDPRLRRLKTLILFFVMGSALAGVSLFFWFSPTALTTRFWGLLILPLGAGASETVLPALRSAAHSLDAPSLLFLDIPTRSYATTLFIALFFLAVLAATFYSPRFWCRYLCPAGAAFALLSFRPFIRRTVSDRCVGCGECRTRCPMGAIPKDPRATRHNECITCESCVKVCPVQATAFSRSQAAGTSTNNPARDTPYPEQIRLSLVPVASTSRRWFLLSGLAGVGTGVLALTNLENSLAAPAQNASQRLLTETPDLPSRPLIRPPGAVPETLFQAQCIRCGECMRACPTNTLQPSWLRAGPTGMFSPALTPVRGPCEPLCTRCGDVCPTQAIRSLPLEEKLQAKAGTSRVLRKTCLAWAQKGKCLVCYEVCPFAAVELRRVPGNPLPVPFVLEERCWGCGFCEHHCPTRPDRAIVVYPHGQIRLEEGSHAQVAQARGLRISTKKQPVNGYPDLGNGNGYPTLPTPAVKPTPILPPGFTAPPD